VNLVRLSGTLCTDVSLGTSERGAAIAIVDFFVSRRKTAKEEVVKNIFSADEPNVVVEPEFSNQPQRGTAPIAPGCNPGLPASAPVELSPIVERVAQHAGVQTDWKKTPIR
jgi:hypothetical protein